MPICLLSSYDDDDEQFNLINNFLCAYENCTYDSYIKSINYRVNIEYFRQISLKYIVKTLYKTS